MVPVSFLNRKIPTLTLNVLLSFRVWVYHSNTRIYVRLLGPCFKTGRLQPFCPHLHSTDPSFEGRKPCNYSSIDPIVFVHGIRRFQKEPTFPRTILPYDLFMRTCLRTQTYERNTYVWQMCHDNTRCNLFPFSDFRYSFTLFSKFFASFPHGTCSLSVSRHYLALEGIYLPLWAAVPSNSTRRMLTVRTRTLSHKRDFYPLWYPFPRDFNWAHALVTHL